MFAQFLYFEQKSLILLIASSYSSLSIKRSIIYKA